MKRRSENRINTCLHFLSQTIHLSNVLMLWTGRPFRKRKPIASSAGSCDRACSSVGQSTRLISVGSEVQIFPGPPLQRLFGPVSRALRAATFGFASRKSEGRRAPRGTLSFSALWADCQNTSRRPTTNESSLVLRLSQRTGPVARALDRPIFDNLKK